MEYILPSFIVLLFLTGTLCMFMSIFFDTDTPRYIPTKNNRKDNVKTLDDDDLIIVANELFEDE